VFFFASRQDRPEWGKFGPPKTWLYDVKTNRFTDLAPKSQPPGDPRTVVYLPGQDAIFAILGKRGERQQWIYSLRDNRWRQLPLKADREIGFAGPYAQTVYVPKYGVLVNLGSASRGTAVMRPEVTSTED